MTALCGARLTWWSASARSLSSAATSSKRPRTWHAPPTLGERLGLPQHPYRWRVARARLCEAQGDLDAAVALVEEAERVYVGDFSPDVRPVPALRARLLLAQGRVAEAQQWAEDRGLSADDDLSYVREYEHVTLARILLHRSEGSALLERLRVAAEEGGRVGTLIEILALQALDRRDVVPLERALRLAEAEGYVRVFVGEGPAMVELLEVVSRQQPEWAYPRRLLDAVPRRGAEPAAPQPQQLVDPLSPRELDVLRLLATDLDGPASPASSWCR